MPHVAPRTRHRRAAAVFVNGRMLERSELDVMMADLDRRYAAMQ